jgi:hypothetical protein
MSHCYRVTIAINNQCEEVIKGETNCSKREIGVSDQSRPTHKSKAYVEVVFQDTHKQVYQHVLPTSQKYTERHVYQVENVSTKAAYAEGNHEVNWMVAEVDLQ